MRQGDGPHHQAVNLSLILFLLMFIFALLAMNLFGGKFTSEYGFEERPRTHFDNIGYSMVTMFVVLSGENWNAVFYDCKFVAGWAGLWSMSDQHTPTHHTTATAEQCDSSLVATGNLLAGGPNTQPTPKHTANRFCLKYS